MSDKRRTEGMLETVRHEVTILWGILYFDISAV
jgi:hypothetical protein